MFFAIDVDTLPYRHSCRPEAVAAHIPIGGGLNRLLEATVLDMLREPRNVAVLLEHLLALAVDIHEPAWMCSVLQLGATAVAVRVFVLNVVDLPDNTLLFQIFGHLLIDVPDLLTFPWTFNVVPFVISIENERHLVCFGKEVVIFTIPRCLVSDAGAVLFGYEVGMPHLMGIRSAVRKQRLIAFTDQFFPLKTSQHFVRQNLVLLISQHLIEQACCENQFFFIQFYFGIFHIAINDNSRVGVQCPWCRSPGEQI